MHPRAAGVGVGSQEETQGEDARTSTQSFPGEDDAYSLRPEKHSRHPSAAGRPVGRCSQNLGNKNLAPGGRNPPAESFPTDGLTTRLARPLTLTPPSLSTERTENHPVVFKQEGEETTKSGKPGTEARLVECLLRGPSKMYAEDHFA